MRFSIVEPETIKKNTLSLRSCLPCLVKTLHCMRGNCTEGEECFLNVFTDIQEWTNHQIMGQFEAPV